MAKLTLKDTQELFFLREQMTQAHQTATRFQQLQQELSQLQQSLDRLGLIVLDSYGKVQLMTSQATRWLQLYFPSHNGFSKLPEQLHSWIRYQISQLNTERDIETPFLPLRLQQGNRQLTIRLVIDQPGEQYLLVLAEEQMLSLLASLELIGLSKREAEVLFWIIQGKDNKTIAVQLSIHVSTIRKHLENIYHKLDVQSRTEAIALALEKLGCSHSLSLI
jgi:DNA-binding CsgD family transcriptional regulator